MSKKRAIKVFHKPKLIQSIQDNLSYWNPTSLINTGAQYLFGFGQRGNGKTTAILKFIITDYIKSGYVRQGAIIRRWLEDFKGFNGPQLFQYINTTNFVEKTSEGQFNTVLYKGRMWYLAFIENGEVLRSDSQPFCYGFSIVSQEHYKSTSFPNIFNILFDECISSNNYLPDEFNSFMNLISTIIRNRTDVKIFMIGNSISKYCPYFREMGLNRVKNQKQGTIDIYTYGTSALKVAVEYCKVMGKSKEQNAYFAFNNPNLNMITDGGWQIAEYPKLPVKYDSKDIKYIFYISFFEELFQCNIIYSTILKASFIFIHPKTTNIYDKNAIIFDTTPHAEINYRRRITKPTDELTSLIYKYFIDEKVFYSDNSVGDTIHNYLKWCKKEA